jgi:hypothetical protein
MKIEGIIKIVDAEWDWFFVDFPIAPALIQCAVESHPNSPERERTMADVTRREAIHKLAATAGVGALLAAAAPAQARANAAEALEPYHHEAEGSEVHVEWGIVNKPKAGEYMVRFRKGFSERPAVLLTPLFYDDGRQVGAIETLIHVGEKEFRAVSDNAADNYFVSWLAIGKKA